MNDDKIEQLRRREHELRDGLKDVQETVFDLNNEEATLLGRRDEVRAMLKAVEKKRHAAERADRDRRKRLGKEHPSPRRNEAEEALRARRVKLDHDRARLKAREEKIDADLSDLNERRRPFVQTQRRMTEQIDECVKQQHKLHLDPTLPVKETTSMNPSNINPFHRAATHSRQPSGRAPRELASASRLDDLKKQLDKPAPAPQLNPPGMKPDVGKHIRDNKAIGDEITRIQQAMARRRGQARGGFNRSANG